MDRDLGVCRGAPMRGGEALGVVVEQSPLRPSPTSGTSYIRVLRRILLLGTSVNKGGLRGSVAEADGGIVAIQLPQLAHLTHRLLRRWFRPAGHVERSACKSHRPSR
jgi:hypothetical protein